MVMTFYHPRNSERLSTSKSGRELIADDKIIYDIESAAFGSIMSEIASAYHDGKIHWNEVTLLPQMEKFVEQEALRETVELAKFVDFVEMCAIESKHTSLQDFNLFCQLISYRVPNVALGSQVLAIDTDTGKDGLYPLSGKWAISIDGKDTLPNENKHRARNAIPTVKRFHGDVKWATVTELRKIFSQFQTEHAANPSIYSNCNSLSDIVAVTLQEAFVNGLKVNKCKHCRKYFVPMHSDSQYCDRPLSDNSRKTCKDVDKSKNWMCVEKYDELNGAKFYVAYNHTKRLIVVY